MPKVRKSRAQQQSEVTKKAFKHALINKNWTVGHLAHLLGKNRSQLSKTINHPMNKQYGTILLIADKLDVNLGEALNGVKTWEK